jgi:hypothetical protein
MKIVKINDATQMSYPHGESSGDLLPGGRFRRDGLDLTKTLRGGSDKAQRLAFGTVR